MFELSTASGDRATDELMVLESLDALLETSRGDILIRISSLANAAALLAQVIDNINWVGFYLRSDDEKEDYLSLGPFWGKPACTRISVGKGVCGMCCALAETQLVDDVSRFKGHIACDSESRSELVVPIIVEGNVVAVLDIDSAQIARFSNEDAAFMEKVADIVGNHW